MGFSQLVIEPGNAFAGALAPLATRTDLKLIGHNLAFDVGMLERAGIPVRCRILDTQKLLKLVDSDRGWQDAETDIGKQRCRTWRSDRKNLNYRLKDLARHLLRVHALDFPGAMATLPVPDLVKYLKSDLVVTQALFEHIDRRLSPQDRVYADALIGPLNAMLVGMSQIGVQADAAFVAAEGRRLVDLMAAISDEHRQAFGQRLDVGDEAIRSWVYRTGLKCRRIYSGKKRQLSVKADHLERLAAATEHETVRRSLHLIHDYKLAQSLMVRIRSLQRHIDPRTGRIHSQFQDFQAAGRISSTNPNLQQLAAEVGPGKRKQFLGRTHAVVQIRSRNVLVATPGYRLVAFDIAQADNRVLVGRISQADYRFFQNGQMVFALPVRNVSWRLIRRVRTAREEAPYEGFDKTRRQLFNHIAQGGTADVAKIMMLRSEPICRRYGGRLLIQIHDELVFEVPEKSASRFARVAKATLELPPTADFRVPIVVEPKAGTKFGEMVPLGPADLAPYAIAGSKRAGPKREP